MHFGIRKEQDFLALVVFATEKRLQKNFEDTIEIGRQIERLFIDSVGAK